MSISVRIRLFALGMEINIDTKKLYRIEIPFKNLTKID